MFKTLSVELRNYLASLPEFKAIMERDGKLFLFPIVADISNALPLSTYVLGERLPDTKDSSQIPVTLSFYFTIESYDLCCEFTDTMTQLIDDKYILQSSSIEYNDESGTFSGTLIFNII